MAIKYKSQKESFDLLCKLDDICRKNNLKYSLAFETLYGAYKLSGFLEQSHSAKVIMPINDYNKFLEISQNELEMPYYIENYNTDCRDENLYTQLKKRSGVILGEDRKKDETYYDYNIDIYPIISISDNENEYLNVVKEYVHLRNIVDVRGTGPKHVGAKTKYYKKIKLPLLKKDSKEALTKLHKLIENKVNKTRFVLIPIDVKISNREKLKDNIRIINGIVKLYNTYEEYSEIIFEGRKFSVIKEYVKWLRDYYCEYFYNGKLEEDKGDILLLRGHEERRKIQMIQLELLLEFDRICRKHNIPYSIMCGTLLGAVRHKGFIPWDYDIDVVLLKKDYDRFFEVAFNEIDKEKFFFDYNDIEPSNQFVYSKFRRKNTCMCKYFIEKKDLYKEGISIDIFPLYNGANTYIGNRIQTKFCNFFKTICWASCRAKFLPLTFKNLRYKIASYIPLKFSYKMYMIFANMYEKKNTSTISWLVAKSNPYNSEYTNKANYIDISSIKFEGHDFSAIKDYDTILRENYGYNYLKLPPTKSRYIRYTWYYLELGDS